MSEAGRWARVYCLMLPTSAFLMTITSHLDTAVTYTRPGTTWSTSQHEIVVLIIISWVHSGRNDSTDLESTVLTETLKIETVTETIVLPRVVPLTIMISSFLTTLIVLHPFMLFVLEVKIAIASFSLITTLEPPMPSWIC